LVVNTRQKIKKSNYNKASVLLNELIQILDKALRDNFEPLYKQIVQEVDDASSNLKNTLRKINIDLDSVVVKALRDFENNTRKDIYDHIKENVSDSSFKNKLEELLQEHSQTMIESIPKEIEKRIIKFQESITEVLMNFKRRVDLVIQDYQTFDFGNLDSKFNVDLQMGNGIDKMALTGSLIGAGGLAYSAVMFSNSWNPLGWTMFAIGVVSVLIGGYKSFRKFLSDDYKKSEQRKSAEKNIENIIDEIKPKMMENIKPLSDEFSELVDKIINDLDTIVRQRKVVNEHVKTVHKELVQIAKLIKIEGES